MMQAIERFDPDRGFRLATYAMWWIRAAVQEYILHSWSLVKMGTTVAQKKLFFNLRKLKGQMQAIEEGDMSPENVTRIAYRLKVSEADVISMNRRLASPDHSLNAPVRDDTEDQWQDWLVDEADDQEIRLAEKQEKINRSRLLAKAMTGLEERERHILAARAARGFADHPRGPLSALPHLARAGAPDRVPCPRQGPEVGQERHHRTALGALTAGEAATDSVIARRALTPTSPAPPACDISSRG